jgi:DNA-binding beta-propeller fold protein YncE
MLAIIYLAFMLWVGDALCRRFYRFVSVPHRLAAAFLVGLLACSWFTYLGSLVFASASRPLLLGNLLFFVAAIAMLTWPRWKQNFAKTSDSETESALTADSDSETESALAAKPGETESAPTADSDSETESASAVDYETETENALAADLYLPRPKGSDRLDWVLVSVYFIFACWMMFASLNSTAGKLQIGNNQFSDFGPNTAIMQSFAVGHNFPTEYPHFSGDRIRYHFLFYFQAGNLEFLGLDPAWSLNALSILSLVAMLVLVMVLGEVLFNSRAVGRVGSALFFFFGSLSYFPFLHKQDSVRAAIRSITSQRDFLPSIFPYRGELWGVWSQVVFLNQRHLASAIAMLLLVLIFLVIRYRAVPAKQVAPAAPATTDIPDETAEKGSEEDDKDQIETPETMETSSEPQLEAEEAESRDLANAESSDATASEESKDSSSAVADDAEADEMSALPVTEENEAPALPAEETPPLPVEERPALPAESFRASVPGFIFSGALLGLLPMWNSAVFAAAAALLVVLFILFPLKKQMLALAIAAGVIALPQVIYLSTGSGRAPSPALLHWGYTLDHPTIWNIIKYLGFTFGFKWLLVALALVFAARLQRRFFVASLSLILVPFLFQISVEVLANHKFLHIWLIIINLFVAYGLWRLWHLTLRGRTAPGKLAAILFVILIIPGGIIDFFPIHNAYWTEVTYKDDRLVEWLTKETDPRAIFLTDRFVNHPILMAGRRVFYGWPYYAWSAGYRAGDRDGTIRQLWHETNPQALLKLLHDNNISYVAIDDGVRHGEFGTNMNESVYRKNFPLVFQDGSLVIFKVTDVVAPTSTTATTSAESEEPAVNMFAGGKGTGKGQLNWPRGLAVDAKGNILVADTNNGRIQKFSPEGNFLSSFGTLGAGEGEFREPTGIAVDRKGNIYVADFLNQRVQKLKPEGTFIAEWKGPADGFLGPRDIAIGPDNSVYVVDEGHTRIVKSDRDGKVLVVWGTSGDGDGQFNQATSVAVDEKNDRVYVADPRNRRIEVFDIKGQFVATWFVEEWRPIENAWYMQDLVVDSKAGRLYATSTQTDEVLVFDLNGNKMGSLKPSPPDKLEGASALVLTKGNLYVLNTFAARVSRIDLETK